MRRLLEDSKEAEERQLAHQERAARAKLREGNPSRVDVFFHRLGKRP